MASGLYDSKHDTMTLYDSFMNEVLLLTPGRKTLRPPIDLNRKGPSTQAATRPVVWVEKGVGEYTSSADQIIQARRRELRASYLPAPYVPCVLNTETDVVQASVLWVLHPVIKALQAQFPQAQCAAEVTLGDCRCDALITVDGDAMVVLEYKNRGYLERPHFDAGCIVDPSPANRTAIDQQIYLGINTADKSLMDHNAAALTKQAAAYATKWQTRYVALFDWDSLFLWNFAGMRVGPAPKLPRGAPAAAVSLSPDGHADWAYGTWVADREDYRTALLGFVLHAYRDKRDRNFKIGKEAPWRISPAARERMRQEAEARRLAAMSAQQQATNNLYGRRG